MLLSIPSSCLRAPPPLNGDLCVALSRTKSSPSTLTPMTDALLDVPTEFIEPLGKLAIIAGRIELYAALSYRAFLAGLRSDVRLVEMTINAGSLSRTCNHVTKLVRLPVVADVDPGLPAAWKEWRGQAEAFAEIRNEWVHATWARNGTNWYAVTATRSMANPEPVTADAMNDAVGRGLRVAKQGENLMLRISSVAQSDAFKAPVPNNLPAGVTPI